MAKIEFPLYRKYAHEKTWFKINSENHFEELQILGASFSLTRHEASILPDFNYIYDLIHDYEKYWKAATEAEYVEKLHWCNEHLTDKTPI